MQEALWCEKEEIRGMRQDLGPEPKQKKSFPLDRGNTFTSFR